MPIRTGHANAGGSASPICAPLPATTVSMNQLKAIKKTQSADAVTAMTLRLRSAFFANFMLSGTIAAKSSGRKPRIR